MATYVVGDVQGCYTSLQKLLTRIHFDASRDRLQFVGDLVNRGPQSLEVLRFVRALGSSADTVLGNHDLHLLAVAYAVRAVGPRDTLAAVLAAPDRDELLGWLRRRPLLQREQGWVVVHAGLLPQWDIAAAEVAARELQGALQGNGVSQALSTLFGNAPNQWRDDLSRDERLRVSVNAFTRLRFCDPDGRIDFAHKGAPGTQPAGLVPWFEVAARKSADTRIAFGHWSSLPQGTYGNTVALDGGCVWGRALSALRLEDERLFSVPCDRSGAA